MIFEITQFYLVGVVIQSFLLKPSNINGLQTSDKQYLHQTRALDSEESGVFYVYIISQIA